MKREILFLRKKQRILRIFEFFIRYKINLGKFSIMRLIHIYLAMSKIYPKKCLL
jgi:hypothetical protein